MGESLRKIVVSAVNLSEGGPLSILRECLDYLSSNLAGSCEIIALVNNERLFDHKNIRFYSFPQAKRSWPARLYYEYHYFSKLAKQIKPFLWLSLHDITPNVAVFRLAVYCQNASPFYKLSFKEAMMDPKFALFNIFYKYLYGINIRNADFVIVQQQWFRQVLIKLFRVNNVVVAHPEGYDAQLLKGIHGDGGGDGTCVFFYPAFPRVFKNFEVICKASEVLQKQGVDNFQVIFTISGDENCYSRHIYNSFKHIKNIKFLGIQGRGRILEFYHKANCVIFPSKLETWGMPITEAKLFSKPIFLADMEYAHETLGKYDKIKFFNPDDFRQLAAMMKSLINGTVVFEKAAADMPLDPFSRSWKELFDILLKEKDNA
jgi:glycosyltransferase involved in cell wall biosynthesis